MKGVVATPMPKRWYNKAVAAESDNPIDAAICADRKPYFMIYRYPELRSRYNTFQKSVKSRCEIDTGFTLDETIASIERTQEQSEFIEWYDRNLPVQRSNGVINRICRVCEDYFTQIAHESDEPGFDPEILKAGIDYSKHTKEQIVIIYREYMSCLQRLVVESETDEEFKMQKCLLMDDFKMKCSIVTPSEYELCDVVVDICYGKEKSKQFAWDMCGDIMIENLVRYSGGVVNWPKATARGDVVFGGKKFKLEQLTVMEVDSDEGYYS